MVHRSVVVASTVGLHARPAALVTQAASRQPIPVTIAKPGGDPVDARSILMVLALGVAHGDTVVIAAEGEGAAAALDELETLLATNLDAED